MTLSELKAQAQALGLTKDFISQHGDLRYKSTWQAAINACEFSESETKETVSDNLFEPLVEPEVINITPETHPEIWELLQPPTEPENAIATEPENAIATEPLQLPNKSALYDDHWVRIGDWVKLDEAHTCQVTHVLAENDVEVQVEETGEVLNVTPNRLRHLTEAELDEVDPPEIWQHLPTPTEARFEQPEITYQVITEEPETSVYFFSAPEKKKNEPPLPKLPGQDFFAWLFSPPKYYQTSQ